MTKHTPGPWVWDEETVRHGVHLRCLDSKDEGVLVHDACWPVNEADARLIAAAPELLEAAKAAVRFMPPCVGKTAVLSVIAKAEGWDATH